MMETKISTTQPQIERHPLQPFLPEGARLLMLGSFPPSKARWCMDFFYPNPQNDMWRIMGLVFFGDKMQFVESVQGKDKGAKTMFRYEAIVQFCADEGIAIFDTAQAVIREKGNASDEHLEIVEPTDVAALLEQLPDCHDICCTGQKAAETLASELGCQSPHVGGCAETDYAGRRLRFWRMPSSSRAYPLAIEKKADAYRRMFQTLGMC